MASQDPRDHHVVPQFFLRNFAVDAERTRITTLAKEGNRAVWMERAIRSIGYERDFYVHFEGGRPVSVETAINRRIETPISQSDTWAKITAGHADALDASDRAILYALVRHLEARTPHMRKTGEELRQMAADLHSDMPFTPEERRTYATDRANPERVEQMFNFRVLSSFDLRGFESAAIMVHRSPIRLRTSSAPAMAAPAPPHPAMDMPLPGMVPFQRCLSVDPYTFINIVEGDFGGLFSNGKMDLETAQGINRTFAGQFAKFPMVRHLITDRDHLREDMCWAPYELVSDTPRKIVFRRTDS